MSTMLKPFYAEARKVSGRKTIQSQHCENQFVPGWTDFLLVLFKEIIRDKVFKLANEALNPSLKDLARQGLISFTKHKRPISSEDLGVLYAANQLGLILQKVLQIRHGLTPFSTSEREAVKTNAR